jgi:hypothetical protein
MLKDAAIHWVRANCTDPKLRADFSRKLKDVLQRRLNCWFAVGSALTRTGAPYMIHCFAGELFIFQLSSEQAVGLKLAPNALAESSDLCPAGFSRRSEHLAVSLSKFELDAPVLTATDPICGVVEYEVEGEPPTAYCLRMDGLLGLCGDDVAWTMPRQTLSRSGQIRFSFSSLGESVWPMVLLQRAPVAVFLRLYADPVPGDVNQRRAISNTCGALLDVR